MKLGYLLNTQTFGSVAELWRRNLRLAELLDDSGFYSVHLPEHHMRPDNFLPQPLVAAAAISERTRKIRIGTSVLLAPLRNPIHLAEEANMVDVLSGGRLILGLGIGNYKPEFDLFGLEKRQQAKLFDEVIDVLKLAWSGERFSFEGQHFTLDDVIVTPKALQQGGPEMWIGAISEAGCLRAARVGAPLILDPLHTIESLEELVAMYRQEARAHGHAGTVILMRWGWLTGHGTPDALEEWWLEARRVFWIYLRDIPRIESAFDHGIHQAATDQDLTVDAVAPDRLLVGDASAWINAIEDWSRRLDCDHMIVRLEGSDALPEDAVAANVRGIARYVLPALSPAARADRAAATDSGAQDVGR